MITVDEALAQVLARAASLSASSVPLTAAHGLVLAEDVASDIDSPPYDKSIVDGYAVRADDLATGAARLKVLEEIVAGNVPTKEVVAGHATRIMTGAPLPSGADAVVMVERTIALADPAPLGSVEIRDADVRPDRNILRRGTALRAGDVVLRQGALVGAAAVGLLAEVGRSSVPVIPRPRVAILPTGNELVEAHQVPGPGQIRNSNGPLLAAALAAAGAEATILPVARDELADLRTKIDHGLTHDVLILSGGVSAGVLDLVPRVLVELGAEEIFHKVRLKPGKPLWFGIARRSDRDVLIFGLPGNPVSSFVCAELFVRPAVERLAGRPGHGLPTMQAALAVEYRHRGDRQTFLPSLYTRAADGHASVQPVDWHGSADLRGLVAANCLATFPGGDRVFAAGELVEVRLLDAS